MFLFSLDDKIISVGRSKVISWDLNGKIKNEIVLDKPIKHAFLNSKNQICGVDYYGALTVRQKHIY